MSHVTPVITIDNLWKTQMRDASLELFGVGCGSALDWDSRFWMQEPSTTPSLYSTATVGESQLAFLDVESMQCTRKFNRGQLKASNEAQLVGIAPADHMTKFYVAYNDWQSGKGATVITLDAQTGDVQELIHDTTWNPFHCILSLSREKFVIGSGYGRSAGGDPPAIIRVHEHDGRPGNEYSIPTEVHRLVAYPNDPNLFVVGGRESRSNACTIALYDLRAAGKMPERSFLGIKGLADLNFPGNPGTELTATDRFETTTKIFDIGTGRVVHEFYQGTQPRMYEASICTVRWGNLFGLFRENQDEVKPIRLYNLAGPKGASAPEKEFNATYFRPHMARLTPDLRTILLKKQESPDAYMRLVGFADPPTLLGSPQTVHQAPQSYQSPAPQQGPGLGPTPAQAVQPAFLTQQYPQHYPSYQQLAFQQAPWGAPPPGYPQNPQQGYSPYVSAPSQGYPPNAQHGYPAGYGNPPQQPAPGWAGYPNQQPHGTQQYPNYY